MSRSVFLWFVDRNLIQYLLRITILVFFFWNGLISVDATSFSQQIQGKPGFLDSMLVQEKCNVFNEITNLRLLFQQLKDSQYQNNLDQMIQFDDNNCLIGLVLDHQQLHGSIPPELGNLTHLRFLSLSHNALTGSIPSTLGQLTELQELFLDYNQLSGLIPPQFGKLEHLRGLFVDHNQLSGQIPDELGELIQLQDLDLEDNQLWGEIPAALERLINLHGLFLRNNDLSGSLPPELKHLRHLRFLYLSGNRLSFPLPDWVITLPELQELKFDRPDQNPCCHAA